MKTNQTFEELVQRSMQYIDLAKAPGFIIGLSGIDSTLAFMILAEAFTRLNRPYDVVGLHFGSDWFQQEIIPWLQKKYQNAVYVVRDDYVNDDYGRWAVIMNESIARNAWVAGSLNKTENFLGTYSNAMKMVSFLPLYSVFKSDIRSICRSLKMPTIALDRSMMADCECGRDQLELIFPEITDAVIRNWNNPVQESLDKYDQGWVKEIIEYVSKTVQFNSFKNIIPYKL